MGFNQKKVLKHTENLIQRDIKNGFSGISLWVNYQGSVIYNDSHGFAVRYDQKGNNLTTPTPLENDMLFDLASITKIFSTTYALMYLYERNKITLDQPITHYIPEFSFANSDYIPTIRQLLSHMTGLAPEIHFYDPKNPEQLYSHDRKTTTQMLLTRLPLASNPLDHVVYSDNNMMILGCLIERITNQKLDVFINQAIYQPLGLTRTCFNPLQHQFNATDIVATQIDGHLDMETRHFKNIRTTLLRGEVHDEKALYSMGGVAGHAGLFSTVTEAAKLASLLWKENEYFSSQTISLFTQNNPINSSFAMGFRLAKGREMRPFWGDFCSDNSFGHLGFTGICLLVDPETQLTIVICGNSVHCPIVYPRQFIGKTYHCGKFGNLIDSIYTDLNLTRDFNHA